MIRLIGILLFGIIGSGAYVQPGGFELVYEINQPHHYIWTDHLQNLYVIEESGIQMYSTKGELQFRNSQLNLGEITTVDFNFSLKPMLFFGNMNTLIILDNTLSMQGNPVKLTDYNMNWVTAAAKSVDNHYWFFDMQTFELVRTDVSFKIVRSSGNVSQMLGIDVQPNFIVEHNNLVYVNNPETGILVFDIFGTFFKQIPIKGLRNFQVTDNHVIYFQGGKIHQYNRRTFETYETLLPESDAQNARVVKDMLFVSRGDTIRAYRKI